MNGWLIVGVGLMAGVGVVGCLLLLAAVLNPDVRAWYARRDAR